MDTDLEKMRAALEAPFPPHAILEREGAGRKMLKYVAAHTVIRRLNEATGGRWDFHVTRLEWHGDLLMATGELSIPGMGTRTGIGVQKVSDRSGEDLVKGAASDALKKAATLYGVGLDLYGPDMEAEDYQPAQARPAPRSASTPARPAPAPQSAPQAHQGPQQTIDAAQVRIIQALCDCKGISAESICKRFKVVSLPEMKPADFWTAKQGLEAMPDAAPAEATS